jgi:D-psicose/D-tagatose/L-ribulose 3-epimerase
MDYDREVTAFGASTYLWVSPFGDQHVGLFAHARRLGCDVLEICIEDPALVTAETVAAAARKDRVLVSVCGAFGAERDVSHEDPAMRRRGVNYLHRCIDLAAAVGSPHVAGPMYSATGKARLLSPKQRAQQWGWAVEGLTEVADYAAGHSVRLAIEPLNRFETDFINTVEQGLELCGRIGKPNVGLLLDTFHMNIEERSLADAILRAGDRVFHVHACENDRGTPGSGHVDWVSVLAALAEIDYPGQIVIESFTPEIKEIARAVSMWRPVAASADSLVRDGLAFLKHNHEIAHAAYDPQETT